MTPPSVSEPSVIEARLERLDAYDQIRQLAVRYAAAMRVRDGKALAELYVDDVRVGDGRTGREALREAYFGAELDRLEISVLHPGTHVIDLNPELPDKARGSVYTLGQIKTHQPEGARWIRQAICYFDRYAKRDGQWLFISRDHQLFFGVDHDQRPNHLPPANWPASDTGTGTLPFDWPTWPS
jgi:ketosteroid isomerase-like protein